MDNKTLELEIKGDKIEMVETFTSLRDSRELTNHLRNLEAERDSIVRQSQDLKNRYDRLNIEIKKVQDFLSKLDKPEIEVLK